MSETSSGDAIAPPHMKTLSPSAFSFNRNDTCAEVREDYHRNTRNAAARFASRRAA
jgi:hypothetical protein